MYCLIGFYIETIESINLSIFIWQIFIALIAYTVAVENTDRTKRSAYVSPSVRKYIRIWSTKSFNTFLLNALQSVCILTLIVKHELYKNLSFVQEHLCSTYPVHLSWWLLLLDFKNMGTIIIVAQPANGWIAIIYLLCINTVSSLRWNVFSYIFT